MVIPFVFGCAILFEGKCTIGTEREGDRQTHRQSADRQTDRERERSFRGKKSPGDLSGNVENEQKDSLNATWPRLLPIKTLLFVVGGGGGRARNPSSVVKLKRNAVSRVHTCTAVRCVIYTVVFDRLPDELRIFPCRNALRSHCRALIGIPGRVPPRYGPPFFVARVTAWMFPNRSPYARFPIHRR